MDHSDDDAGNAAFNAGNSSRSDFLPMFFSGVIAFVVEFSEAFPVDSRSQADRFTGRWTDV